MNLESKIEYWKIFNETEEITLLLGVWWKG